VTDLLYARPGHNGIEICVQENGCFRVLLINNDKAFHLAKSILDLVDFSEAMKERHKNGKIGEQI
jgi:hypothetical protein